MGLHVDEQCVSLDAQAGLLVHVVVFYLNADVEILGIELFQGLGILYDAADGFVAELAEGHGAEVHAGQFLDGRLHGVALTLHDGHDGRDAAEVARAVAFGVVLRLFASQVDGAFEAAVLVGGRIFLVVGLDRDFRLLQQRLGQVLLLAFVEFDSDQCCLLVAADGEGVVAYLFER